MSACYYHFKSCHVAADSPDSALDVPEYRGGLVNAQLWLQSRQRSHVLRSAYVTLSGLGVGVSLATVWIFQKLKFQKAMRRQHLQDVKRK
jgi:hypothetical protein